MNRITRIAVMVATTVALGYLSGLITQTSVNTWYPTLVKPSFTPPNAVFPIAWGILYFLMGISAGLVWNRIDFQETEVKKGLQFFGIQFILNVLWSYLFFGLKNPLLALIEIVLLWLMIYETWYIFRKISKIAAWLLVPYLLWVTYAAALNAAIWYLNR
ncbi:TspO/MBR family protein [Flavobacterium rhizosphaerae]|uniref:TspO/MBR family protein n=1 Tax=Flavobacterium rhizosphaerae TaxID=3163298 RepID=A0ABW8YYM2_9FLAO